jgi:hypothetical protein
VKILGEENFAQNGENSSPKKMAASEPEMTLFPFTQTLPLFIRELRKGLAVHPFVPSFIHPCEAQAWL